MVVHVVRALLHAQDGLLYECPLKFSGLALIPCLNPSQNVEKVCIGSIQAGKSVTVKTSRDLLTAVLQFVIVLDVFVRLQTSLPFCVYVGGFIK